MLQLQLHSCLNTNASQITKFVGPKWGPPGPCRPQMGPILAPWTLLSELFDRFLSVTEAMGALASLPGTHQQSITLHHQLRSLNYCTTCTHRHPSLQLEDYRKSKWPTFLSRHFFIFVFDSKLTGVCCGDLSHYMSQWWHSMWPIYASAGLIWIDYVTKTNKTIPST